MDGLNFDGDNLYVPMLDRTSMRMLLAIGAAHKAYIHTMDVNLAFLYGDMHDELYMTPPPRAFYYPWEGMESIEVFVSNKGSATDLVCCHSIVVS